MLFPKKELSVIEQCLPMLSLVIFKAKANVLKPSYSSARNDILETQDVL